MEDINNISSSEFDEESNASDSNKMEVGKIVYILSNKTQKIVPAQIVEETITKKITGNVVSWKYFVGSKDKGKIIDSSMLDGEVYPDLQTVKNALQKRLTSFLEELIDDAKKRVHLWYGDVQQQAPVATRETVTSNKIDPGMFLNSNSVPESQQNGLLNSAIAPGEDYLELPGGQMVKINYKTQ